MSELHNLAVSIEDGDVDEVARLTREAINAGHAARDILEKALVPALSSIGDKFSRGEAWFPELIMAGDASKASLSLLKPILNRSKGGYAGRYLIGTVQGDIHDIGKSIVVMMLEGNGWQVEDLGIDVSPGDFCAAISTGDFDILGLGAYLSMSLPQIDVTIQAIAEAGLRKKIKIMIGGVPVTQTYAERVGADAYGETAIDAVREAWRLIHQLEERR